MPVTCGDIINNAVTVQETPNHVSVFETSYGVVEVTSFGPSGPRGEKGDPGFSGAGEPFYAIVTGNLYATTASIAILADISSSLVPYTGFSLGTLVAPWNSLFVSSSISFAHSGSILATIEAEDGYVVVGNSRIGTSSFGFSTEIIRDHTSYVDILYTGSLGVSSNGLVDIAVFSSQSTDYVTVNKRGVFVLGEFSNLPTPVYGGVIFSGSDLYVGK